MTLTVQLSRPAAVFLLGTIRHINELKALPEGKAEAVQTSAWLEEIEAALRLAFDEDRQR